MAFIKPETSLGYVYILSNPLYPSLVKIGHTKKHPQVRANEISRKTGVLGMFIVEWFAVVKKDKCFTAEKIVHKNLEVYRFIKHKEFFEIDLKKSIEVAQKSLLDYKINIISEYYNSEEYINPVEIEHLNSLKQSKIFYKQQEQYEKKLLTENQQLNNGIEGLVEKVEWLENENNRYKKDVEKLISENKEYQEVIENSEKVIVNLMNYIMKFTKAPRNIIKFPIKLKDKETDYILSVLSKLKNLKNSYLKYYQVQNTVLQDYKEILIQIDDDVKE